MPGVMPSALELIRRVILVAGEAAFLYGISRLLFEWVLRAAWGRAPARRLFVGILRAPGNLLHETSHAIGYLVGGYRVSRLVPAFVDPEGRGYCRPGRAWAPWAVPWLATGVAAMLPLFVGAAALWGVSRALGVPEDPAALAMTADWRRFIEVLTGLDYSAWQTWMFLYLALSIGAELAPSDIDLRASLPALAVTTVITIGGILLIWELDSLAPYRPLVDIYAGWALSWAASILDFGIMAVILVGVPAAILAWPLRRRS